MTYLESYKNCNSFDEYKEMVRKDVFIASFAAPFKIAAIQKAINEMAKIKPEWDLDGFVCFGREKE